MLLKSHYKSHATARRPFVGKVSKSRVSRHAETVIADIKKKNFDSIFNPEIVTATISDLGITFRDRVFTPFVVLWVYVFQMMSDDRSCRNAVANLLILRIKLKLSPISTLTGAYCSARKRLPVGFFKLVARF